MIDRKEYRIDIASNIYVEGSLVELLSKLTEIQKNYPDKYIQVEIQYDDVYDARIEFYYNEIKSDEDYNKRVKRLEEMKIQDEKYIRAREYEQYLRLKQKFEK